MPTYEGLVKQLHRAERELPELTRSVGEAVSTLALVQAKRDEASHDLEARSALVRALETIDAELGDLGGDPAPEHEARRWRRAGMAKKLAVLRSAESDARLEDREAWALSLVELARARVRRAVSELDAAMRLVLEGGVLRVLDGERASREAAARAA